MVGHREALRSMALGDLAFIGGDRAMESTAADASQLDPKTFALVRLGALVALNAPVASFQAETTLALAAGASPDEIVGVLVAVAPTVGSALIVSAASGVGLALGFDVDEALEGVTGDALEP